MAHVREVARKDGSAWECRWREPGGTFKQRTFPTEETAREFVVELKIERRDNGTTTHMSRLGKKFQDVADASMAASAHRLKPKTLRGYEDAYRLHIFPTFGQRRINTITSMDVEKWMSEMQRKTSLQTGRPYAAASVRGAFVALTKVFSYAVKHRLIPANPCAPVERPRLHPHDMVFLAPDEVAAVASELDALPPYGLLVRVAAYSGLRAGELAALRIRDVNFLRGHVEVRRTVARGKDGWTFGTPKSARSTRDVPLPRSVLEELRAYLAQHPHRTDPQAALWPGRRKGGYGETRAPLDYDRQINVGSVYRNHFAPALARLGIQPARWHDLRHFYASACAAQGIDIRKVSRWMGHANINTTDSIYTHLFNGSAVADMDRLDALATAPPAAPVPRIGRTAEV
ncbi:tyrosine-type recombinase/integrase [Protaetiibacter larvae]|uniref:Site-specific integrase n=1 Tax=Protaetiibacter larvae TaxID=2592654 RepID=A0A5C1Y4K0_9MICO|nr:tyrosine-type recombinase/integrase [Protaetiibacter larvae]QEO08804.1 site-specific integrase [Protaetiibacter larvae]